MSFLNKIKSGIDQVNEIYREQNFKPYAIEKKTLGMEFKFLIGDLMGERWYGQKKPNEEPNPTGSKEILEMEFVRNNLIQSGDIIFECGGHHGWTAIQLANWVGQDGKVISFEANSKNYQILKQNMDLNHLDNVVVEHKAVSSEAGTITIFKKSNASIIPELIPRNLRSTRLFNVIYGLEEVQTIDLDTYVAQNNVVPTFLKIDVEGYEFEVLKGAKKILETAPKILLEIHTEQLFMYGTSVRDLFDAIDLSRYKTWIQLDDTKTPVEFDPQSPPKIEKRAHLYAIPNPH
ncbi:FkbM family methyltransferase [Roseofilum casamattae]|uniref:FkbM family methyltransferase n=1 Tax=Roseofilum casamattae BLCC-M143 TaxID=3022442 RepID=A0ABT7BUN9_9CYAN|nr:FkbM family methyltransferase [Roseofilum casamattae]MDJ1182896.1 FkbM family methyltransferase [Roseofilum casamattae BLCC-M143]